MCEVHAYAYACSDRIRPVTMQYGVGHVTSAISLALPTFLQKSQKGSESPQTLFSWHVAQGNWKGAGLARLAQTTCN